MVLKSYYVEKLLYLCSLINIGDKIMAMTIKSTPILWGEDAERFNEEADRNGKLPTPKLSEERRREIRAMWEECKRAVFPPKKQ